MYECMNILILEDNDNFIILILGQILLMTLCVLFNALKIKYLYPDKKLRY